MKTVRVDAPVLLAMAAGLSACGGLETIPFTPTQTPETWLQIQPYAEIRIGAQNIVLVQPSTSIIVYLLGMVALAVGVYFLKIRGQERSRFWWGIGLLLWGLGAFLAGTSYEAFSYAIKCAGRSVCLWTSWWEVLYLILSSWSIAAILLAVAHSSASGTLRKALRTYAILVAVLYLVTVIVGVFLPVKFLISFESLLVVAAPSFSLLLVLNGWRYARYRQALDLACLRAWTWLSITIASYFFYSLSGATMVLWARGFWFSENDVLHVGLILWMIYIAVAIAPRVRDDSVHASVFAGAGERASRGSKGAR